MARFQMITKEQAASLFEPVKSELAKIILDSWKKIHSTDLNFKSRARACLMWDEILNRANLSFCDSPYIRTIEVKNTQTAHYWFDDKTFFRIKKADEKGFTSNYPTQTAMEFYEVESDMFGSANRLELIYVLSPDESEITDIAVVQRDGGSVNFRFSLLSSENVQQIPAPTNQNQLTDIPGERTGNVAKLKSNLTKKDKIQNE